MPSIATLLRTGSWGTKKSSSSSSLSSSLLSTPFRSRSPVPTHSSSSNEAAELANAMAAADMLVNDDIAGSLNLLHKSPASAYTDLGLSIIAFMQALMGFEPELMREAVERTRVCEKTSLHDWQAAQSAYLSSGPAAKAGPAPSFSTWQPTAERFYPPGSGFAVISAAAQLMHGATGVLDESDKFEKLGAAVKAFFKLRKAYATLSDAIEFEKRVTTWVDPDAERKRREALVARMREARMPGAFDDEDDDGINELLATVEQDDYYHGGIQDKAPMLPLLKDLGLEGLTIDMNLSRRSMHRDDNRHHVRDTSTSSSSTGSSKASASSDSCFQPATPTSTIGPEHAAAVTAANALDNLTDPVDMFVHAASNMAFGALQLVLGMCPPAYRSLLAVVGFRGNRERGLAMLWKASTYPNFCGALSGLILFAYYTGLASFSDILPAARDLHGAGAEIIGYPEERCSDLLASIRARYPESLIWRLVEGRVLGDRGRMTEAIRVLRAGPESNLRQITALTYWQIALDASFVRDWALTRDSFLRCVELNDWTHAYYYYHAACAELELYRDAVAQRLPRSTQQKHKTAAEALFRKAPPLAGHKRVLHKRIPHEVFVERRVARWEQRARDMGIDLADAIGASPAHEMAYIWNGTRKMSEAEARASLADMRWDRCTASGEGVSKLASLPEEIAIRALVVAALLRRLGRFDEARKTLEKALSFDRNLAVFKKEYVLAMATYEMAVIAWDEVCAAPGGEHDAAEFKRAKVHECQQWLDRVCKWEGRYLMDGRFGMRFTSAEDTLSWYKGRMGWE